MNGVNVALQPVLVSEYSDEFELLVVEITVSKMQIRIISGYGPQENWEEQKKTPFFEALEAEIACAETEGRYVIICMDVPLGSQRLEIGLTLRQAWFINGTLFNSEVWCAFSESDLKVLEVLDSPTCPRSTWKIT